MWLLGQLIQATKKIIPFEILVHGDRNIVRRLTEKGSFGYVLSITIVAIVFIAVDCYKIVAKSSQALLCRWAVSSRN